jgi:PAS domain S-box-containing protein
VSAAQQGNLKNRLERVKGENKALKEKLTSLKKEHRLVEKALREGRQLLNNTPVALFLIQERKIVMTNETAREWLGYKEEDILGRSFLDFVHPDSLDHVSVLYRKMISGRSVPDMYETYVIRKGGDTLYCEVQVKKIKFQGRRAFLMNLIALDRRIQMERQRSR